jgi:F-type H+-transporting ATPase subunit b
MDATFWALVALIILIAICIYFGVPRMLGKALDERAARIGNELEEARRLREEAQALLVDYQKRREQAEAEASEIVAAAKREAAGLLQEAHQKTEEYVARRTALAEQKIGQAEREAVAEVRAIAVDLATEAARRVLAERVDAKAGDELFRESLKAVQAKLN